jgi:hypothetical protein
MPTEVFIGVDVCKPRLDLMILLAHKTAPYGLFALPTGSVAMPTRLMLICTSCFSSVRMYRSLAYWLPYRSDESDQVLASWFSTPFVTPRAPASNP